MFNKKIGLVVFMVAIAVLVLILVMPKGPKIVSLADLIPDNAVVYLQFNNFSQSFEDFRETSFYKQVSESALWKKLIATPKIGQKLALVSEMKSILNKQYVLAGFKNNQKQLTFLHVARISWGQKIKQDVIKLFLSKSAKADFSAANYKRVKITTVKADNFNINYAIISDCLIVCEDEAILKKAIDLGFSRAKNSLNASERFMNTTKRIADKNAFLWGWFDYGAQQDIQGLVGKEAAQGAAFANAELADTQQPFSDVCWQVALGKDIKLDIVSIIDQKKLALDSPSSRMIKSLLKQETSGEIINFFPVNTLFFFNYNFGDAALGYDYFKSTAAQSLNNRFLENFNNSINKIEEKWGISIEHELIPYLGKEINFGLLDMIQGSNGFPRPGMLFAVEVKDADKFQDTIERIYKKAINDASVVPLSDKSGSTDKSSSPYYKKQDSTQEKPEEAPKQEPKFIIANEDYKGAKINFIQPIDSNNPGAAKPNLPYFAIKGNFFLASAAIEQIKNAIDLFDSKGANFKSNQGLSNIGNDFKKDNFLFYLDSRGLADRLIMILAPLMKSNQQISEIANIVRAIKSISANGSYNSGDFVLKVRVDLGE